MPMSSFQNRGKSGEIRKPAEVVPEHKKRAIAIWGALLLAVVGYTAWQIHTLRDAFENPSTTFALSDELYTFPPMEICFDGGMGCDTRLNASDCIDTATTWVGDPCYNKDADAEIPGQWDNCLSFDLPSLNLTGYERGCDGTFNPSAYVEVAWYSSFDALNEDNYTAAVALFLGNGSEQEYTLIPYSRHIESSDSSTSRESLYVETQVTFGKTTRTPISGDPTTIYPILTISTSDYASTGSRQSSDTDDSYTSYTDDDGNSSKAMGSLFLTLTQGTYSVTDITEIKPDIGNLFGNIGGFWELLLIAWGICFIATRVDTSTHKGRDFTKLIRRGKDIASSKRRRRSSRRRSSTRTDTSDAEGPGDERAEWSAEERDREDGRRGDDIIVVPPVRPPTATSVSRSFTRSPIRQDRPVRTSSFSLQPV